MCSPDELANAEARLPAHQQDALAWMVANLSHMRRRLGWSHQQEEQDDEQLQRQEQDQEEEDQQLEQELQHWQQLGQPDEDSEEQQQQAQQADTAAEGNAAARAGRCGVVGVHMAFKQGHQGICSSCMHTIGTNHTIMQNVTHKYKPNAVTLASHAASYMKPCPCRATAGLSRDYM